MFFLTPTLDLKLFLLVNQEWRNELFDIIMPILSSMSVLLVAIALCIIVAVIKGGKKQVIFFLILLVGMGLSDFTTNIVKKQVNRARPHNVVPGTHHQLHGYWQQLPKDFVQTQPGGTSYPSGHSANTMCLAVLMMLIWPALKKWPLLLPVLVGYSRLYLGKHYPTDVIGGWLMGAVVATAVWLIWKHTLSQRVFPKDQSS